MIIPTNRVDSVISAQLQKICRVGQPEGTERASADSVSISRFAALVERGRRCAMSQPAVRADLVAQARKRLEQGEAPRGVDIAGSMINSALEGKVEP